jgi:hypothetical protein
VWRISATPETGITVVYCNTAGVNKNPDTMTRGPPHLWGKVGA